MEPLWDVAIVGAGPGGLSAAYAAASAGARTVVLERAAHPRYKTCGGGLIGLSAGVAGARIQVPVRDVISTITVTDDGRRTFTRQSLDRPLLTMVRRAEFDHAWYRAVCDSGAEVRQNVQVKAIDQDADAATVTLADGGRVRARTVIGADGTSGVTARHVGVAFAQQDLGLEVELAATDADRAAWQGRVLLDWGPVPGSYGWVFPKGDELTVGVIAAKGHGAATKAYLASFVARLGLAGRPVLRDSGHLTRCRTPDAPLRSGRVLVVGDAAGLLEPWTREGISYALRSGMWAGQAAAADDLEAFDTAVREQLLPEMAAGRRLLRVFSQHRHLVHAAMATRPGARAFAAFCRGELTLAQALQRRPIALGVRLLGGAPR